MLEDLADMIDLAEGSSARRATDSGNAVELSELQLRILTRRGLAIARDRGKFASLLRDHSAEIRGKLGPDAPAP